VIRGFALFRRVVAITALVIAVASLAWLIRTWERGDQLRISYERSVRFADKAIAREICFAVGSRAGRIGVDLVDGTGSEREGVPKGWWFEHLRTDQRMAAWTLPQPVDEELADHFQLVADGLWPPLHERGIGVRFYLAPHDHISGPVERSNAFWMKVLVPHWLVAMVAAFVSFLATLPDWRARRRRLKGLCVRCGYDLRGSPDQCPECGAKSNAPHAANSRARAHTR
jgi:hypothetical protein